MTDQTFKHTVNNRKFEALFPPGAERFVVPHEHDGLLFVFGRIPLRAFRNWCSSTQEGFARIMRDLWRDARKFEVSTFSSDPETGELTTETPSRPSAGKENPMGATEIYCEHCGTEHNCYSNADACCAKIKARIAAVEKAKAERRKGQSDD